MKTLDAVEFDVLTDSAAPLGEGTDSEDDYLDSTWEAALQRLEARGLVALLEATDEFCEHYVATPLGREALRIARAVRALEGA